MPKKPDAKKKPAAEKKATSKSKTRAAKTAATRVAKTPPPRPTDLPKNTPPAPRLWVLAAFVAADNLASSGATRWDDPGASAARLLAMRAEGLAAEPTDELTLHNKVRAKPTWFISWKATAAKFRELAVDIPHTQLRAVPRGAANKGGSNKTAFAGFVSIYALRIATDPKHELYDRRATLSPTPEMRASVDQVGVLSRVQFKCIREGGVDIDYVADGRQRINTARAVNLERLYRWWQTAYASGRATAPPPLIVEVAADEVVGLKEAQRASATLNAPTLRRDDTLQDQAARAAQLRGQGYSRDEIAVQLGVSPGTVSNLLSLRDLTPPLLEQLWSGRLPPGVAYLLAKEAQAHQADLWTYVQRVPTGQRLAHLRDLLAAEGRVNELQTLVDSGTLSPEMGEVDRKNLAQAKERLEQLRSGGGKVSRPLGAKEVGKTRERFAGLAGRGGAVLRAALDFTLGVIDLEDLLVAAAQVEEVADPLLAECPSCCVDPGARCQDEDVNPEWPNEIGTAHPERYEAAQRLKAQDAGAEAQQ